MNKREEILKIVEECNLEEFVKFIRLCKTEGSDLAEIVSGCSKKQFDKLWEGTQQTCATTMLNLQIGDEGQQAGDEETVQSELKKVTDVLDCVVSLALATIHQKEIYIPTCLISTAVVLHGLLLPMPEKADQLKNNIAKLFEEWWNKDLPGKDDLMTNTFIYLLQRSLHTKTVTDVKRVWSLHEALLAVDMTNESSESLKELIQKCTVGVNYLKAEEGLRFLGFVMSLDLQFTESLHRTIKNHIPTTSSSLLGKYGEIYFRAWQKSSGAQMEKIETFCIQDLMYHTVHAGKPLASSLRKVLAYIHHQKKQKGVDDMLLKLYDPILWRSLKVANPSVRANAASLLIDVFPLQDSASKVEETDKLLQKQFDILQELLDDPCPVVRSIVILGLFRIMSMYWEMIPHNTLRNMNTKMIQELVWDSTSADVRESVIKGLTILLDNHLCHALLKPVLPELCNFIHDTSEKVRIAMMDLLLKVKGMRTIKFWNIVPVEHLLARLEIDSPPIGRRIMQLLFTSFLPLDKSPDTQVDRCVTLIQTNPGAARQFFHHATHHMSLQETCDYITLLCRYILKSIKSEKKTQEEENDSSDDENQENKPKPTTDDDTGDLSVHNTKVMIGLVEAMVILWTTVSDLLQKKGNKDIHKNLQKKFSLALPEMFKTFDDPQICAALILLAGHVQSNTVPTIRRTCLAKLRNMPEEASSNDYGCLLEAMCNWGKVGEVFELVEEWLQEGLNTSNKDSEPATKSGKKGRKSVGFVDLKKPQPGLAIEYISYMIKHPGCQTILLTDHKDKLVSIKDTLKIVMECIERSVGSTGSLDDKLLTDAFMLYCKVVILLHNEEDEASPTVQTYEQILTWTDVHLIPILRQDIDDDVQGGKRPRSETNQCSIELASEVIKVLLSVCGNMLLLGIGDVEFTTHVTDFCTQCLQSDESMVVLPNVLSCMYQVTEYMLLSKHETDDGIGSHCSIIPGFIGKLFVSIAAYVKRKKQHSTKLLSSVKSPVIEILSSLFRNPASNESVLREVTATLVAAVLAELSNSSEQRELDACCKTFTELPILSCWLCELICKKVSVAKHFVKEICSCVESGAVSDVNNLNGAVSLLGAFSHGKPNLSGLKDCWTAIQIQYDKLKDTESNTDEGENNSDLMKDIDASLKDCQQKLNMVPL